MKPITATRFLKNRLEWLFVALLISAFVIVASIRLGRAPVPETDESYTLQVAYEMVNRGHLSLPMYRYLGGNIENVWHSYTPVYFVILGGFFKLTGWGLLEGRWFNLITSALTMILAFLIGRKLFNGRVGVLAVLLLAGDQTFFERSRLVRNDFAAAFFAMLAFYLYEVAEQRKQGRYFIAAGLAAGAGVMCHTNILYMFGAIGLLMLLRNGWRIITKKCFYQYTLAALAVMAYEIVYDLIDYKNFVLQNREDRLHFGLFEPWGFWRNLVKESDRYLKWYAGGGMFMNIPRTTLHLFQALTCIAIVYLLAYTIWRIKLGDAMSRPAVRIFIVTTVAVLFHALITSHKDIYYMAHLAPWFALCVAVMLNDAFELANRVEQSDWAYARLFTKAATILVALALLAFGLQLARQTRRYIREVRNPELASFEEFQTALRSVVPDGVCPVAMKAPEMWLAFPEQDRCFATIEKRMTRSLDLDGNEYAVIQRSAYHKNRREATKAMDAKYHLLGELTDTPYGTIRVYYTGGNAQHLARPTKRYHFFGRSRGYVTDAQLAEAQKIWGFELDDLRPGVIENGMMFDDRGGLLEAKRSGQIQDLWPVELKPEKTYLLSLDATTESGRWDLLLLDEKTGAVICQEAINESASSARIDGLFKTASASQIRVAARSAGRKNSSPLRISRISISEIPDQ